VGDDDQGYAAGVEPSSRRITSSPVAVEVAGRFIGQDQAGCMMVARAMATRWRWPPESWSGRWSARFSSP
jgi:hypothetical protein